MFRYVNRKGVAYFLHESRTKAGKVRYTLKRSADGAMSDLPAGYEALENVNGQASVRKARPRQIAPLEEKPAQAARKSHGLGRYRIEVKGRHITVFEPDRDVDEIAELLSPFGTLGELGRQLESAMRKQLGDAVIDGYVQHKKEESRRWLEETTHYSPDLRGGADDLDGRGRLVAPQHAAPARGPGDLPPARGQGELLRPDVSRPGKARQEKWAADMWRAGGDAPRFMPGRPSWYAQAADP